jgi:hypothetical protein
MEMAIDLTSWPGDDTPVSDLVFIMQFVLDQLIVCSFVCPRVTVPNISFQGMYPMGIIILVEYNQSISHDMGFSSLSTEASVEARE